MENEELPQYMRIADPSPGGSRRDSLPREKAFRAVKALVEVSSLSRDDPQAVQLLREAQVVTVKEQSGCYVRSR